MTRVALQYVFAALLALLSVPVAGTPIRVVTCIEIVDHGAAEQETPREVRRYRAETVVRPPAPAYESHTRPEPETPALFQRPPPFVPLFA